MEESHPQGRNANWGDIRELFAGDMGGRGGQISFGFGFPFMGFQYMAFHQGANRTPQQAAADAQMAKMVFTIGSIALFFLIFF